MHHNVSLIFLTVSKHTVNNILITFIEDFEKIAVPDEPMDEMVMKNRYNSQSSYKLQK